MAVSLQVKSQLRHVGAAIVKYIERISKIANKNIRFTVTDLIISIKIYK